ncbi:unnamed protein product [Linum trigynum]|uniref:F-box domain-containing protein n=1 Tax=Linum trigynum TaxID=586398 RepID=A0AAV2FKB1_9ROSI
MADWSQLPRDLIERISKTLDTATELLRFRSVCNSWRSSACSRERRLSSGFQILPNGITKSSFGFCLSKRAVYLIGSPDSQHLSQWLVKLEEVIPDRKRLVNPLSRNPLKSESLPENFPRMLDLNGISVKELGQAYVLRHVSYRPNSTSFTDAGDLYMEKVVMMWLDSEPSEFVLLTIHLSGKLVLFRSGDRTWTIIGEGMGMDSPYDDVIVHKGKLIGVDNTGKVVSVSKDADLTLVANPVFGGDKKYLIQSSRDQLLLVDMYLSIDTEEENFDIGEEFMGHLAQYMRERTVRFKVYRLDAGEKAWVELGSLGDTVLFIGDDSSFAASSSDLYGCKGNCIFFVDTYNARELGGLGKEDDGMWVEGICVFELESGSMGPLVNYPEYHKIFWPPPRWLLSPPSEVELAKQAEGLSL